MIVSIRASEEARRKEVYARDLKMQMQGKDNAVRAEQLQK